MAVSIVGALIATLLWAAAAQTAVWASFRAAAAPHPWAVLLGCGVLAASYCCSAASRELAQWRDGWLGALSSPALRQQALWCRQLLRGGGCGLAGLAVAVLLMGGMDADGSAPAALWWALPWTSAAGAMLVWPWLRRTAAQPRRRQPSRALSVRPDSARSSAARRPTPTLARWALQEQWASLRSRRFAAWLALPLLLIPGGADTRATLALLGAAMMASAGLAAWQRGAALLIRADAWLRVQPLGPALLPPLLWPMGLSALIAIVGVLIALALMGLQMPMLIGLGMAAGALAVLHACAIAAWRHDPAALRLRFPAAVCLLALLAQGMMPLAPLAWALVCGAWIHRAKRR